MTQPVIPPSVPLRPLPGIDQRVHVFVDPPKKPPEKETAAPREAVPVVDARDAVYAALGARRPLLVKGEPGVGKTQLAEAVATALGRLLLSVTVDSRTESRDLLYSFDAVRRLAEAQLQGAIPTQVAAEIEKRKAELNPLNFLVPGPLWWAFDWVSASKQAERAKGPQEYSKEQWQAAQGAVLLIDEIDKAEADVPNGLLEALGSRQFVAPHGAGIIASGEVAPLVIITTNEERSLPDPFVRRCVVLTLKLPGDDHDETNEPLREFLIRRGEAHFPKCGRRILAEAAAQLVRDRFVARRDGFTPLPGQAEYLDLVRATVDSAVTFEEQEANLKKYAPFILRKQGPLE